MPFGFWVLGNRGAGVAEQNNLRRVSNAFRLLGSGERIWAGRSPRRHEDGVSNAFRLLGSGGPDGELLLTGKLSGLGLKCLSAFGFWGTSQAEGEV